MTTYLILIFVLVALAFPLSVVIIIIRRSRLDKHRIAPISLNGSTGHVVSPIAPYGAVMVNGELWPARSFDGVELADGAAIRVIEPRGYSLLVTSR